MNTINPPGNEEECAHLLGGILEDAGFDVAYHELSAQRASLVARIGGSNDTPPLCFTGHIDTVPLGAASWQVDPLSAETDADRLYGRGTSDMKSGVAAFVTALVDLAPRLHGTAGIELVITAGEETGCEGAFQLVRRGGALGRAGAVIVGEPTSNSPLVGHKGVLWLEARTRGVTAHASMPEKGVNAIYKAARAVSALEALRFQCAPHPLMGSPTLNVGTIHGGLNVNSVPDETRIGIDIRTTPNVDHGEIEAQIRGQLGEAVEIETILDVESVYTEPEHVWVQEVFEVMQRSLGRSPRAEVATYFTDAAALNIAYGCPPTIILGPGEPEMAHQTDEYCVIDRIDEAVAAYEEIARRWCGI
jgi:succinyl-diaminopimelate desuccinylase